MTTAEGPDEPRPPQSASSASASGGDPRPSTEKTDLRRTLVLALGALGVVYGDIGTSPLYTVK